MHVHALCLPVHFFGMCSMNFYPWLENKGYQQCTISVIFSIDTEPCKIFRFICKIIIIYCL